MGKFENRILNVLASLVARFLVGSAAALAFLAFAAYLAPRLVVEDWKLMLSGAFLVGLFYAAFGLRKGPGLI